MSGVPGGMSGHGAQQRRGRSASGTAASPVLTAMARLLAASGVNWTSHWTRTPWGQVHHIECGAGRPLVLLHGGGGGAANWCRVLGALGTRFRVLAPDLPGYGLSPPVPLERPLGVRGADWIAGWLQAVGAGHCGIVGTSFGGLVALRYAHLYPERVARLAVIDAVGLGAGLTWLARVASIRLTAPFTAFVSRAGTAWTFRVLLVSDPERIPAPIRDALIDYLFAVERAAPRGALTRSLSLFCTWRGQREVLGRAELARITAPTLIIWGERDNFVPARHGVRGARYIPAARFLAVSGAGHSPNWEAPDRVVAALLEHFDGQPA